MKNKKGFTLMELLVVIAVIAVLMVLIVPNVIKMFNEAKEKANVLNVKGHISNINNKLAEDIFSSSGVKNGVYTFNELGFSNYPSNDSLRCNSYQVNKNIITYASGCMLNDKSYCYENNEAYVEK